MARNIQIDSGRLWKSLMEMARIGATEKGGVCRLALTDLDKRGRDLFKSWCEDAGCTVRVDPMGNVFARRPGRDNTRAPVGTGSHLDTQPTGGKFDGVYGVLAGLEVIRTLNDHAIETETPVELAVWTNEEGSRFAPAMVGSGVYAGVFDLDYAWSRVDKDGKSLGEELERIDYRGDAPLGSPFSAFFEVHIEQGPILENAGRTIGVVSGVQGIRWFDIEVLGAESHAGPTPMELRRDALLGAAKMVVAVNQIALDHAPAGRATVGELHVLPGSRNTVAGHVKLTVDTRHPESAALQAMERTLKTRVAEIADKAGLKADVTDISASAPVSFDPQCVESVRKGAEIMGYPSMEVVSGAGHDSVYISRIAPTGMVFIPCENGISHNEIENASQQDIEAGCNVLLHAMLDRAEH